MLLLSLVMYSSIQLGFTSCDAERFRSVDARCVTQHLIYNTLSWHRGGNNQQFLLLLLLRLRE